MRTFDAFFMGVFSALAVDRAVAGEWFAAAFSVAMLGVVWFTKRSA
jgi:hypothetical protein